VPIKKSASVPGSGTLAVENMMLSNTRKVCIDPTGVGAGAVKLRVALCPAKAAMLPAYNVYVGKVFIGTIVMFCPPRVTTGGADSQNISTARDWIPAGTKPVWLMVAGYRPDVELEPSSNALYFPCRGAGANGGDAESIIDIMPADRFIAS